MKIYLNFFLYFIYCQVFDINVACERHVDVAVFSYSVTIEIDGSIAATICSAGCGVKLVRRIEICVEIIVGIPIKKYLNI